ncbi:MAG: FAD-dependent oxidoreductase, partial [Candidatus Limnocylindrales bacterium]
MPPGRASPGPATCPPPSRYRRPVVEQAQAVVIGGGVGGTSIAYHLTELGWRDVVLVERAGLTSGSTFHSAGLVGQLRSSTT